MRTIEVLDHHTIDQIAAGEVVERPASIVKELVENSMDAGADAITVEIRGGGIDYIRVTDNGCGIYKEDIPNAFLRHATSKIHDITDLERLDSMGFRGEALASIASVSRVTLMTRRAGELLGYKLEVDGGAAGEVEELGAPDGTTVIAAHLFYNTPVRRKFLKSATSEGNAVEELMERLALARPDISYKFTVNGKTRFMTSGSGDLRDVIYRIYGRDASRALVPVSYEKDGIRIDGYLGEPSMNRPNRGFETYFLNRRYIRSDVLARGIEEGYRGYTMQHRFPFCVLHITMDAQEIDVNVHPSKLDVRFHDRQGVCDHMTEAVADTLHAAEMIPAAVLERERESGERPIDAPEPFETGRREAAAEESETSAAGTAPIGEAPTDKARADAAQAKPEQTEETRTDAKSTEPLPVTRENRDIFEVDFSSEEAPRVVDYALRREQARTASVLPAASPQSDGAVQPSAIPAVSAQPDGRGAQGSGEQLSILPKERVISANARRQYRLIGCIFNTYWMFSYQDSLYFVDQHAAHEKVNYERLVEQYARREVYTQQCEPPIIVSLSPAESEALSAHGERLRELGFTTEPFGGSEYAISTVPYELYRKEPRELFLEILNELALRGKADTPKVIDRVLATIACKSAVKGGDPISMEEMDTVLDELLTLKNPYHCPHGRPTIFSMSRTELERRFKRIVS